jgi:hypothetical protein
MRTHASITASFLALVAAAMAPLWCCCGPAVGSDIPAQAAPPGHACCSRGSAPTQLAQPLADCQGTSQHPDSSPCPHRNAWSQLSQAAPISVTTTLTLPDLDAVTGMLTPAVALPILPPPIQAGFSTVAQRGQPPPTSLLALHCQLTT